MKKIRDLFYNISDIIIILLIIALAAFICFWRMQIILGYSTANKEEPDKKIDIDFNDIDLDPEEKIDPIVDPINPDPQPSDEVDKDWVSGKELEFIIDSGKGYNEIMKNLSESFGLSKEDSLDLYSLLYDKGIELKADSRIGTGTFTIPEGSTIEEIVRIIARMEEKKD